MSGAIDLLDKPSRLVWDRDLGPLVEANGADEGALVDGVSALVERRAVYVPSAETEDGDGEVHGAGFTSASRRD